jgi:hypothetical protein
MKKIIVAFSVLFTTTVMCATASPVTGGTPVAGVNVPR